MFGSQPPLQYSSRSFSNEKEGPQAYENIPQIQHRVNTQRIEKPAKVSKTLLQPIGQTQGLTHSKCLPSGKSPVGTSTAGNLCRSTPLELSMSPEEFFLKAQEWNAKRLQRIQEETDKKKKIEAERLEEATRQFKSATIPKLTESKVGIFLERTKDKEIKVTDRKKVILDTSGAGTPFYDSTRTLPISSKPNRNAKAVAQTMKKIDLWVSAELSSAPRSGRESGSKVAGGSADINSSRVEMFRKQLAKLN